MELTVICIKDYPNKYIMVGKIYKIIDADMYEYLLETEFGNVWISKNDTEHFKYCI